MNDRVKLLLLRDWLNESRLRTMFERLGIAIAGDQNGKTVLVSARETSVESPIGNYFGFDASDDVKKELLWDGKLEILVPWFAVVSIIRGLDEVDPKRYIT